MQNWSEWRENGCKVQIWDDEFTNNPYTEILKKSERAEV